MLKLKPDEKIYVVKRQHLLVLKLYLFPFVLVISLILLAILILFFKEIDWPQFLIKEFPQLLEFRLKFVLIFLLSLSLPIFWVAIFLTITRYYLTYWVVTNQRTIYVKLDGLFHVSYSSVYHDKIQDVAISVKGILSSIFRFGNIQIQTASELGQFVFDQIPRPLIVKQTILEAKRDYLNYLKQRDSGEKKDDQDKNKQESF